MFHSCIPNFSLELYLISLQLKGECDKSNLNLYKPGQVNMNFVLPGSSHGLKITNNFRLLKDIITQNSKIGFNLLIDNMVSNDLAGVYYQTFYNDDYFGDDRYQPAFIPLIYDEPNVSISVKTEVHFIDDIWVCGYIKTNSGILKFTTEWVKKIDQESTILEFMIPDCGGDIISEVGSKIKTTSNGIDGNGVLSRFIVESFNVSGKSNYIIDPQYQKTCLLENVSSFVNNRSKAFVEKSEFNFIFSDEQGLTLTGNYYTSDLLFVSKLKKSGEGTIDIVFWAKGLYTYHSLRLNSESISLVKTTTDRDVVLNEKIFSFNNQEFIIKIHVEGKEFKAYLDGDLLLEHHFDEVSYGHFGYGGKNSILRVSDIEISNDIIIKKNAIEII